MHLLARKLSRNLRAQTETSWFTSRRTYAPSPRCFPSHSPRPRSSAPILSLLLRPLSPRNCRRSHPWCPIWRTWWTCACLPNRLSFPWPKQSLRQWRKPVCNWPYRHCSIQRRRPRPGDSGHRQDGKRERPRDRSLGDVPCDIGADQLGRSAGVSEQLARDRFLGSRLVGRLLSNTMSRGITLVRAVLFIREAPLQCSSPSPTRCACRHCKASVRLERQTPDALLS